ARNSCRGAWTPTLDLQANVRPWLGPSLQRRLAFMISFVNPLAGLDQLLHGANDLRGWGQPSRPDPTLLYVRGFDPQAQRFLYQVNERFGDTRASRTALLNPFQIGIQARLQIGPDRQRELMMARLGALSGRGGGAAGGAGGTGGFDARTMVDRVAPNVAALVLGYRDTLKLTDAQVATLTALQDSMTARADSLAAELQGLAAKASQGVAAGGDPMSIFRTLQPRLQQARAAYLASVDRVRGVLTPEQWQRLPEEVRNPPARGAGRQRRDNP
ncbi:MAG TPA: Spy/CpxP family protein refolding chaperone, partial [Gemmatimonadaceae bacterium]|nr:Spy/CpxP family protein refolding chaperone [Gemmatimonadaceae bacterium]